MSFMRNAVDDGLDARVEARHVAASGQDSDPHSRPLVARLVEPKPCDTLLGHTAAARGPCDCSMPILIQERQKCAGFARKHAATLGRCDSSSWASSAWCCSRLPGGSSEAVAGRRRRRPRRVAPSSEAGSGSPNKIKAPVYCPSWLPDPLVPQIGNRWNNIDAVDKDRSYLESWAWQEAAGLNTQEIHVILRGYPGKTAIPRTCQDVTTVNGKTYRKKIAVLPGSARHVALGERGHGDDVHRQPWRRLLACPLRLAPRRLALHPQRARGAAALVLEGRRQPEAHARRARARPTDLD